MSPDGPGFGPWAPGLPAVERAARWRSLAALSMVFAGGRHLMLRLCIEAERDPDKAALAWIAVDSLPALTRRRLLAAYCALEAAVHHGEHE